MLVLSNVPGAQGLARAEAARIPTLVINHKDFTSRADFDAVLDQALKQAGIELVCNAGFMRLHTEDFVRSWWNRHLNIHPSLLPAFKGLHTHARVLEEGREDHRLHRAFRKAGDGYGPDRGPGCAACACRTIRR